MARPTTVDDRQDRRVKMRVVLVKRDRWLWLGDGVSRWWAVRYSMGAQSVKEGGMVLTKVKDESRSSVCSSKMGFAMVDEALKV
ncbi:hypothetical protein V6N13_059273 [Hibiscus sabdariffa]